MGIVDDCCGVGRAQSTVVAGGISCGCCLFLSLCSMLGKTPAEFHEHSTHTFCRFLQVIKPKEGETETMFTEHVQQSLASALKVASTQISTDDVEKWLAGIIMLYYTVTCCLQIYHLGPPRPQQVANGPILAPSEFDPSKLQRPSELDTMVHQVTAVLPQVPYTVIKKDLSKFIDLPSCPFQCGLSCSEY